MILIFDPVGNLNLPESIKEEKFISLYTENLAQLYDRLQNVPAENIGKITEI